MENNIFAILLKTNDGILIKFDLCYMMHNDRRKRFLVIMLMMRSVGKIDSNTHYVAFSPKRWCSVHETVQCSPEMCIVMLQAVECTISAVHCMNYVILMFSTCASSLCWLIL